MMGNRLADRLVIFFDCALSDSATSVAVILDKGSPEYDVNTKTTYTFIGVSNYKILNSI